MRPTKKLFVGTGSLRRESFFNPKSKLKEKVEALKYCLEQGSSIHISPTYGNSFSILSEINLYKFDETKVISKIDFDKQSNAELQLELTSNLLNKKFFDVQILINFKKYFSRKKSDWCDFERHLISLKEKYLINEFYLFPYHFDSDFVVDLIKESKLKFNFALMFSLLDREFKNSIINQRKNGSKIITLKGYGSIPSVNLSNNKKKIHSIDNISTKEKLKEISSKYTIDENKLRLIFTLKNPNIDYSCISFSSLKHAKEAISIINQDFNDDIIDSLSSFHNNFSNFPVTYDEKPRKIKRRFIYNHSFKSIYNSCSKLNLKMFGLKIILFSFLRAILKINRDFLKYLISKIKNS